MAKTKMNLPIESRLHILRAEKRISQAELAEQIDVTRATINAIERGNYNPSLELAFRLARYFETTIEDIFYVEEKNQEKKNDIVES